LQGEVVLSESGLLVSDMIAVVVAGRSCSVRVCIVSFRYDCNCCCREKLFCQSLAKLKEDVVKANTLVREANFLVQEMAKPIEFSVTLQIPASNLSPNRRVAIYRCFLHTLQLLVQPTKTFIYTWICFTLGT